MFIVNGPLIRTMRTDKDISLIEFSRAIEVHDKVAYEYEIGKKQPSARVLKLIADYLDTTMDSLMLDIDPFAQANYNSCAKA